MTDEEQDKEKKSNRKIFGTRIRNNPVSEGKGVMVIMRGTVINRMKTKVLIGMTTSLQRNCEWQVKRGNRYGERPQKYPGH